MDRKEYEEFIKETDELAKRYHVMPSVIKSLREVWGRYYG